MGKYGLTLVLSAKLKDTKQKEVLEKIKKAVEEAGGKVVEQDEWGKRTLAYPINKQEEGAYFFLEVELPAEKVRAINRLVEMEEEVLRHLLVRV